MMARDQIETLEQATIMVSTSLSSGVFHSYRITSSGHAHATDVVLYIKYKCILRRR
jgi:hypothetical protein